MLFFLLNAAAPAPPSRKDQYGSVCKSESGGHETENEGVGSRNLAHDGSQWASFEWGREEEAGDFFSLPPFLSLSLSLFLHGEQVGRLEPNIAADTTTKGQL